MAYNWDYLDSKAYNNRIGHYKSQTQLNFIIKHIKPHAAHILDVAGGSGRFAIPLLNHVNDVTVVDMNASAIELLKSRNDAISALCADFLEADFDKTYSSIVCIEAMCYFKDVKAVCRKMNTLLEKNGNLIFTYTNTSSWRYALRTIRSWAGGESTYFDVPIPELKKILQENQFEIEAIEGMNWIPLPLSSNSVLVDLFVFLEKKLKLNRWTSQSPWLLISAKKVASI